MVKRYPEYIMRYLRLRQGLNERDESMDEIFNGWKPSVVFSEVLEWEGFIGGWDVSIKTWILDIYGIDLDKLEGNK